jgi:hypothetical protein
MKKLALHLGGFPPGGNRTNNLEHYLRSHGYEVVAPYLFPAHMEFNLENLLKLIDKELDDRTPDLISGISLDGLILPHVAIKYPNAKLIFSTSAPYFAPNLPFFHKMLRLQVRLNTPILIRAVFMLPRKLLMLFLKGTYDFYGDKKMRITYETNTISYLKAILRIDPQRHLEMVKFVLGINNTELIKTLSNKSLIISATKDSLMPARLGKLLHKYLKNSTYFEVHESHLNFITNEESIALRKFLRD